MKITKAKWLEFGATAANQAQYFFPDLNDIKNSNIWGIETYGEDNLTTTLNGNTLIADADVAKAFLTLYFKGGNYIVLPLFRIIQTQNNATSATNAFSRFPALLAGQVIEWSKCFVQFGSTSGLTTGRYFGFNIYYTDPA